MNGTSPIPNARRLEESDFKYFAEIEQCFQSARGTPTLVSPLDWALIESWKEAGVPVEAVRAGVARAFDKFKKRRRAFRKRQRLPLCKATPTDTADLRTTAANVHDHTIFERRRV